MTIAFKYCTSEVFNLIAGGKIRLRRLAYYRDQEANQKGDPSEGYVEHNITKNVYAGQSLRMEGPHPVMIADNQGKGVIRMQNVTAISQTNPFVFCASIKQNDSYWSKNFSPPNNTCVAISDFEKLHEKIFEKLTETHVVLGNQHGRIFYENPEIKGNTYPGADPFRKTLKFREESEIRSVFWLNDLPINTIGTNSQFRMNKGQLDFIDISLDPFGLLLGVKLPRGRGRSG